MARYIIKVYADTVISGARKYSSIPEKDKKDVYEELKNRMNNGIISQETFESLTVE